MSNYQSANSEILALFTSCGKEIPEQDSDIGSAVQILQTICNSQSHAIPDVSGMTQEDSDSASSDIFKALKEIESNIGKDEFLLGFDGNEYRIISESAIWEIYRDEIQRIVEDCYSDVINLDKIPSFIAISIDWEETAENAYADGYGHTFSGYDGSEEEAAGYHIFRIN